MNIIHLFLLFSSLFFSSCFSQQVSLAAEPDPGAGENPFTQKAHLIGYWEKKVSNDLPKPAFLLNKASPLSVIESESFSKLADQNALSAHFPSFCNSANLMCFPDKSLKKHDGKVDYKDFGNYVLFVANLMFQTQSFRDARPFFSEKMLKTGTVMRMPDIRDKMPERSFLPRLVSSKLPFSTSKLGELKKIFHARDNSSMAGILAFTLKECERRMSRDENKRCISSVEDMLDFVTSVLGQNVIVRTTENTKGSNGDILIGSVKIINNGKVTASVSCHQILFPYIVYSCHAPPNTRVYEADILDPKSKAKINRGVAVCHVDPSDPEAFVALGSSPGKIGACHWIFENDMSWTIAD